ncbi:HK97 family phage prohead protease [Bacillus sp. V2I10]|uniref:HK97 family phage prohead protease n=1 Tax=Bacillus sp. V2I10 TaxID=3042276 RepID=UPI00278A0ADE|nr:HK97 family phage prohead protease [Bacillus sp. V2I10]MDQ0861607.1 HK97 family phage prohead protease [Bacillus sp. V2I10]
MELRSDKNKSMTVSGYVNKTEQLSNILGSGKKFVEKISKGAFDRAVRNAKSDIHFLAEHNPKELLSSTRNGSLTLTEDSTGFIYDCRDC